jgi:hypothetical protein
MWSSLLDPIEMTRSKLIEPEVTAISDRQTTLFDLEEYALESALESGAEWGWLDGDPKLGTKDDSLVPNSPAQKLGTKENPVPNFESTYTWEEKYAGKYLEDWQLPVGCFDRKWIKNHQYWCWRYYDRDGKKRSIHLHKDYNKAVRKAIKIGVPFDAKLPNLPTSNPPPTTETT